MNPSLTVARQRGLGLVEVLIAGLILGVAGLALFTAMSSARRGRVRAGEYRMSILLAGRILDRVLAAGYPALAAGVGTDGDLDLSGFGAAGEGHEARMKLEERAPGLIRIEVTVRQTPTSGPAPAPVVAFRYISDPILGLEAR